MKYLNQKIFVWLIIGTSVVFYLLCILILPITDETLFNYLKPITTVVTLDTIIILGFTKWIWKCKLLYSWLVPFPNLNGTWKGVIKTNWIDEKTGEKPDPIPVILTIKQSFTNISCVMRTEEMSSYSFANEFVIDRENQILKLVYSYDSIPKQTVKDRSHQHFGTMYFDIIYNNEEKELNGDYWTGRKTTGRVDLVFWQNKYVEKYPEELGEHPVSKIREVE